MTISSSQPDFEFFLKAERLDAFRALPEYRDLDLEPMVGQLRIRWQKLCQESIQPASASSEEEIPSKLDEIRIEKDGRIFVLNGVIHGLIGGGTSAYRDLIRNTLRDSTEPLLFEAGFNHMYGEKGMNYVSIPDFAVLGFADTCKKGLDAGRILPLLLKDLFLELFSLMQEDAPYHLLEQEQRRGLCGVLPTRIEIEWDRVKPKRFFSFEDYPNIVRRSAFMSAFAEAWCQKNNQSGCRLVMGDFHLTESAYFLQHPDEVPADLRRLADQCTSENPKSQTWKYLRKNILHNSVGGFAGFLGLLPYFLIYLAIRHYIYLYW
ncbi:MAG: hypothetical protein KKB51_24950 [Candidatus Riflebacteria bacterium]|nr:hypothetical protein [Candidatus Riflebacteria bacterium]